MKNECLEPSDFIRNNDMTLETLKWNVLMGKVVQTLLLPSLPSNSENGTIMDRVIQEKQICRQYHKEQIICLWTL